MVTIRNQQSQQNHQGENPVAILAEMRRELEMLRKMRDPESQVRSAICNQ